MTKIDNTKRNINRTAIILFVLAAVIMATFFYLVATQVGA